jgi:hypothetical protein
LSSGFFIDEAGVPMYYWAGMMRQLTTMMIAIVLSLALAGPSHAIDAKKKSTPPGATQPVTPTPDTSKAKPATMSGSSGTAPTSSKTLLERLKSDVRESSKKADTGKYDNYIDANNDGVDDRVKEKPATVEPAKEKVKRESAPPSNDNSARTRTKKKPR